MRQSHILTRFSVARIFTFTRSLPAVQNVYRATLDVMPGVHPVSLAKSGAGAIGKVVQRLLEELRGEFGSLKDMLV